MINPRKMVQALEKSMVKLGAFIVYLIASFMRGVCRVILKAAGYIKSLLVPAHDELIKSVKKSLKNISSKVHRVLRFAGRFKERRVEIGFFRAFLLQAYEVCVAIKKSKAFFKSALNHVLPVAAVIGFISVVNGAVSADYGVAVEYNGTEIAVVTADDIVESAQKALAQRVTFYDDGQEAFSGAKLTVVPLEGQVELADEEGLADIMSELYPDDTYQEPPAEEAGRLSEGAEASENSESAVSEFSPDDENKIRAFAVTVDGEFVGAVSESGEIENYLEGLKSPHLGGDVVDISFDKEIEYAYEQFVSPEQLVEQSEIIELFGGLVAEPVYYEVVEGDTPWDIAMNNGLTVDELSGLYATYKGEPADDITETLRVGTIIRLSAEVPYLQTLITRDMTFNKKVAFGVDETEDPDMYKGDRKVDVEGVDGETRIHALVTYKGGVAIKSETLDSTVLTEPINARVRVGTRETKTPLSTGSGGSGIYFWPVGGGRISAGLGDGRGHQGIDIAAPYGTPIYASESGTVTRAGNRSDGYGNCVFISHEDGMETVYGHLSSIAISSWDYVVKGQLIGYVGSTGRSTGNHLHFEVREYGGYMDPNDYVSQY